MTLHHSFSVEHAELYGIDCAILIHHFIYWIEHNQSLGRNFYEDRTWMFQTQKEIAAFFPYWNRDKVQDLITKLLERKVLKKGNFNKNRFNKTAWYAFENEKIFTKVRNRTIEDSESHNAGCETAPSLNTDNKHIYNKTNQPTKPSFLPLADDSASTVGSVGGFSSKENEMKALKSTSESQKDVNKFQSQKIDQATQRVPQTPRKFISVVSEASKTTSDNCRFSHEYHKFLISLDMKEEDKVRATQMYPEELIKKVVTHCTRPGFTTTVSLTHAIFYFCKYPERMAPTKADLKKTDQTAKDEQEELISVRREITKTLGFEIAKLLPPGPYSLTRCRPVGLDGLEISNDRESAKVYFRDKNFKSMLEHYLRKFDLPIPKLIGGLP